MKLKYYIYKYIVWYLVHKYHDLVHYYIPRLFGYKNGKFYTCHKKPCCCMKHIWKYQFYTTMSLEKNLNTNRNKKNINI